MVAAGRLWLRTRRLCGAHSGDYSIGMPRAGRAWWPGCGRGGGNGSRTEGSGGGSVPVEALHLFNKIPSVVKQLN